MIVLFRVAAKKEEDVEDEEPEPAPDADADAPDTDGEPERSQTETKPKKKKKGKGKGGVQIPEYWPWEEAKKIFEKPDVQPADDVQVRVIHMQLTISLRFHSLSS